MLGKMAKRDEKGFTLIELMIVIAIIGILAAIAIPQFAAYRQRSYNAAAQSDAKNFAVALEAYYVDHNEYTTVADNLGEVSTSDKVDLTITASTNDWSIVSFHKSGSKTYTLSPGGKMVMTP